MADIVPAGELRRALRHPAALDALVAGKSLLTVDLDEDDFADTGAETGSDTGADDGDELGGGTLAALAAAPVVLAGVGSTAVPGSRKAALVDVALGTDGDALDRLTRAVEANPLASGSLALLLRGSEQRSAGEGLVAESAVYSLLQAGPEFTAWRHGHPPRQREPEGPPIRVVRTSNLLHVTLNRPGVHNALNTPMRDALWEALSVAVSDGALSVLLDGEGPSFCSGGDLDEFGTRPDPATAHLIRLRRSAGLLLWRCGNRAEVVLHGACLGAGIELAAFAGRVTARPGVSIALPEVALGLVPGAGGTVSLTRRIGRHRAAYLALSGDVIDEKTALLWGLVDSVTNL